MAVTELRTSGTPWVRFDDFMADEVGVAERVYDLAGEPLTDAARPAMADYLAGHQRDRLGTIVMSAEMFGLDEHNVGVCFTPNIERFLAWDVLESKPRHCSWLVCGPSA